MILKQKEDGSKTFDEGIRVNDKVILPTSFKGTRYFIVVKLESNDWNIFDQDNRDITKEMEPFIGFNKDFFNQINHISVALVNDVLKTNYQTITVSGKDVSFKLSEK
jgi:hypothetical protein